MEFRQFFIHQEIKNLQNSIENHSYVFSPGIRIWIETAWTLDYIYLPVKRRMLQLTKICLEI
jgi:hypothetical protein